MNATELRKREVINASTAERLGYVYDLEIDFHSGKIISIIVPKRFTIFNLFDKQKEYIIPWKNITAVGSDIILVNVDDSFLFPLNKNKQIEKKH